MINFNLQYNWHGDSSAVSAMYFDRTNGMLNVEYRNGSEATWSNVSYDQWKSLVDAPSVGRRLNELRRHANWKGVNNDDIYWAEQGESEFVEFVDTDAPRLEPNVNPINDPVVSSDDDPLIEVSATRVVKTTLALSTLPEWLKATESWGLKIDSIKVL